MVRVIAVKSLKEFWVQHPESEQPLKAWREETKVATWSGPAELKLAFGSASILQNGRVVFNIAGNKYRLIVGISYKLQIVFIKFVGAHRDYDKIDAQTVEWESKP